MSKNIEKNDNKESLLEKVKQIESKKIQEVNEHSKKDNAASGETKKDNNRTNILLDRILGFVIVTFLAIGIAGLGVEFVLIKGPSESLKKTFIRTMEETRRFRFINTIFLSDSEVDEIADKTNELTYAYNTTAEFDKDLITISSDSKTDENGYDEYGLCDDDGDGIIFETINYKGSTGYVTVLLDPTRLFVGMPDQFGGYGLTLEDMVAKYDAIGGINAGGFIDYGGGGTGGYPDGITIVDGVEYNREQSIATVGIDEDGLMYIGYYSIEGCEYFNLKHAVSFSPIIIVNGEKVDSSILESGINPRTCIGQRADGAIVMLVFDGRQAYSIGVTYEDCADVMLSYGVMNAINMDGGNSSCMMYKGEIVNHPTNPAGGTRYLPTAWLYK